jgi:hypothetical protein
LTNDLVNLFAKGNQQLKKLNACSIKKEFYENPKWLAFKSELMGQFFEKAVRSFQKGASKRKMQ